MLIHIKVVRPQLQLDLNSLWFTPLSTTDRTNSLQVFLFYSLYIIRQKAALRRMFFFQADSRVFLSLNLHRLFALIWHELRPLRHPFQRRLHYFVPPKRLDTFPCAGVIWGALAGDRGIISESDSGRSDGNGCLGLWKRRNRLIS